MPTSTDRPIALLVAANPTARQQQCLDRFHASGLHFDVIRVPSVDSPEQVQPTEADWAEVLAASATTDERNRQKLVDELYKWLPAAANLRDQILARPIITIGDAAIVAMLSCAGPYVAIDLEEKWPLRLLAFRSADTVLALRLDEEPAKETNEDPIVYSPTPINPDVCFAAFEAFAGLAREHPEVRFECAGPMPLPNDAPKWLRNLGLDRRLNFDADEPDRPAVLFHTNPEPDMERTFALAGAFDAPIVSMFSPTPRDQDLIDRHFWLSVSTSPPTLTTVLGAAFEFRPVGTIDPPLDALAVAAWTRFLDPGPAFRSLRQKYEEVWYEGAALDSYEDKYHRGTCYQMLDDHLVALVKATLFKEGSRILDLGCGPGSLIERLNDIGYNDIIGVDLSPTMIREAERRFPSEFYPSVTFKVAPSDNLPLEDESIDAVVISGVLHHLDDESLKRTWNEIRRVVSPNGAVVMREPNRDNVATRFPVLGLAHLGVRSLVMEAVDRKPPWEPIAHDDHHDFTPSELADATASHFEVIDVHTRSPIGYFYDTLDADDYRRVEPLDNTLSNQPGLHLFIVARAGGAGITTHATNQVRALAEPQPIDPAHFDVLFSLADVLLPSGPTPGPEIGAPTPDVYARIEGSSSASTVETAAASIGDLGTLVLDFEPDASRQIIDTAGSLTVVGATSYTSARDVAAGNQLGLRVVVVRNYISPADTAEAFAILYDQLEDDFGTPYQRHRWYELIKKWQVLKASWPRTGLGPAVTLGAIFTNLPGQEL